MRDALNADDFYYPVKVDALHARTTKGARITEETLDWAQDLGILPFDEELREHFGAAASGSFAALGYPSASDDYLRIISDTNCAVFVTDDACDGDAPHVVTTDRRSVDDISTTVTSFQQPWDDSFLANTVPLRLAMSDLGERLLAKGAPPAWRARFAGSLKEWLEAVRKEEDYKSGGQVPTPASLMSIRPASGAVFLFMSFIELTHDLALPAAFFASEPVATLRAIASRIILYPHDLFSYKKELENGHPMNLVTSLMHHRGMTREQAAAYTVKAHNKEMRNFDELARVIEEREPSGSAIRSYILGLRHYMHGLFAWQWIAARYSKDFFAREELDAAQ